MRTIGSILVALLAGAALASDLRPRGDLRANAGAVQALAYSPDGRQIAAGYADETIRIWDVASGAQERRISVRAPASDGRLPAAQTRGSVDVLSYSPDGKMLAEASSHGVARGALRLWDAEARRLLRPLSRSESVRTAVFCPDGRHLLTDALKAGGAEPVVGVRDLESGAVQRELSAPRLAVSSVVFSGDGARVAVCGGLRAHAWEYESGRLLRSLEGHKKAVTAVALSPDGKLIATGDAAGVILVRNLDSGEKVYEIESKHQRITSLLFSPTGRTLISGGADRGIMLWVASTGREHARLYAHLDQVTGLAVSPDGLTLASGSLDGRINLWNLREPPAPEAEDEDGD